MQCVTWKRLQRCQYYWVFLSFWKVLEWKEFTSEDKHWQRSATSLVERALGAVVSRFFLLASAKTHHGGRL